MPRQKEKEKIWLEQFRTLYKEKYGIDFTKIIPYESPDFLVNPTFGIEFTELFDENGRATDFYSPAEQNAFREGIINHAKKYCEGKEVAPIEVRISFKPNIDITGAESQKKLGVYLGRYVEKLSRRSSSITNRVWTPRSRKLSGIILEIYIRPGAGWLKEHRWHQNSIIYTNTSPIDELQNTITDKDKKYENYRKNCEACWLVIVVDRSNAAQRFDINYDKKTRKHKYRSKFDRVFYMEIVCKELAELEVSR